MKTPNSEFFQTFLHQKRPLQLQLAIELLINELESELAKNAESNARKYSPEAVKAVAQNLENLALRHTKPGEWANYLQHEIDRKSGSSKALLEEVKSWLGSDSSSPISNAWDEAVKHVQLAYGGEEFCPFSAQVFRELKTNLYPAALREFMAQQLGRLTE